MEDQGDRNLEQLTPTQEAIQAARRQIQEAAEAFRAAGVNITDEQLAQASELAGLKAAREMSITEATPIDHISAALDKLPLTPDQNQLVENGLSELEKMREAWREEVAKERLSGSTEPSEKILERAIRLDPYGRELPRLRNEVVLLGSQYFHRKHNLGKGTYQDQLAIQLQPGTSEIVSKALGIKPMDDSVTSNFSRDVPHFGYQVGYVTKFGEGIEAAVAGPRAGGKAGNIMLRFEPKAMARGIR